MGDSTLTVYIILEIIFQNLVLILFLSKGILKTLFIGKEVQIAIIFILKIRQFLPANIGQDYQLNQ